MSSKNEALSALLVRAVIKACEINGFTLDSEVEQQFDKAMPVFANSLSHQEAQRALHEIKKQLHSTMANPLGQEEDSLALTSPEAKRTESWLPEEKQKKKLPHWDSYCTYLDQSDAIDELDKCTDSILQDCSDPRPDSPAASRKGLVIGEVQAGKTRTYLALANKAIDYGYRVVVILTSNNEDLRKQTQERVDQGILGFDSTKGLNSTPIGIGTIRKNRDVQALTSTDNDFNTASAKSVRGILRPSWNSKTASVVVMKKEHTALESFIKWLGDLSVSQIPVLIIDDESDYASVNSAKQDASPTKINKLLRDLSQLSPRTTYVAVTATPYANVFIDYAQNDDLFPKDFIVLMKTPDAYIGGRRLFGDLDNSEAIDNTVVHFLDEEELKAWLPLKHKKDFEISAPLDRQVKNGIRTFLLASAIRELRMNEKITSSMLIHMSRFAQVQEQIENETKDYLKQLLDSILFHRIDEENPDIAALRKTFDDQFNNADEPYTNVPWDNILSKIAQATRDNRIDTRLVNYVAKNSASSEAEEKVNSPWRIFVGGNTLSRGMTLKGLICSIFYRDVTAADTLQQMARWFGYRPNYADLERIWLRADTCKEFQYIVSTNAELALKVRQMRDRGLTPNEFGLMVKKDPNNLIAITNRNKMRNAIESDARHMNSSQFDPDLSLAGVRAESTVLSSETPRIQHNHEAALRLIGQLQNPDISTAGISIYKDAPGKPVRRFLKEYRAGFRDHYFGNLILPNSRNDEDYQLDNSLASMLANSQEKTEPEEKWNVVFIGPKQPNNGSCDDDIPFQWNTTSREAEFNEEQHAYMLSGKSRRLAGKTDVRTVAALLNPELFRSADDYRNLNQELDYYGTTKEFFGDTPLLMLYYLNVHPEEDASPSFEPHIQIGAKIVIAQDYSNGNVKDSGGVYFYNTVATDINAKHWLESQDREEADDESEDDEQ